MSTPSPGFRRGGRRRELAPTHPRRRRRSSTPRALRPGVPFQKFSGAAFARSALRSSARARPLPREPPETAQTDSNAESAEPAGRIGRGRATRYALRQSWPTLDSSRFPSPRARPCGADTAETAETDSTPRAPRPQSFFRNSLACSAHSALRSSRRARPLPHRHTRGRARCFSNLRRAPRARRLRPSPRARPCRADTAETADTD
jgi:hypothetical protein